MFTFQGFVQFRFAVGRVVPGDMQGISLLDVSILDEVVQHVPTGRKRLNRSSRVCSNSQEAVK